MFIFVYLLNMKMYHINMKLLIISDTHGKIFNLDKIIEIENPDTIIFCGDGEKDVLSVNNLIGVSGNCDFYKFFPNNQNLLIQNKKIFVTHGHLFHTKGGLEELNYYAENNAVDIVIFGHTHIPYNEYKNKILFFNPGSYNFGENTRYGVIEINNEINAYLKVF